MPNLPDTTDAQLLAAIPHMQPWPEASGSGRWALREPGKQILVRTGGNTPFDLSAETGTFKIKVVDGETGEVKPQSQTVRGGGKVSLPGGVVWLTRE